MNFRAFDNDLAVGKKDEPSIPSSSYGRFHAVVIGNQNYRHLTHLKTPIADAKEVTEVLKQQYGFTVELLLDKTRDEIMLVLSGLRNTMTSEDGSLLIYYAGHGYLDKSTDTGYWQPVDAEKDNPVYWIPTDEITRLLKAIRAKHVLVVADSCYSGSLLMRDSEARLPTGMERDEWLKRMQARRSRTALTSGGEEPVADGGGSGHSVFAKAFLEALRENKGILDGDSLFDRIKRPVILNAEQTPLYGDIKMTGHEMGDFLLVPKALQEDSIPKQPERKADLSFLQRDGGKTPAQQLNKVNIDQSSMVAAHNQWRSRYVVPALRWSEKLAGAAQAWADILAAESCSRRQHGDGENVFFASAVTWSGGRTEMQNITPQHVVDDWGNESRDYDYASNSCSSICGHYTQLVWRDTREIGCGMAVCQDKSQIWVCNYYPAGNIPGQKPY